MKKDPGLRPPSPSSSNDDDIRMAVMTPAPESSKFAQMTITMGAAYCRVLHTEAQWLGLRRYQFVELLLMNEIGEPFLKRPRYFLGYKFARKELEEQERFLLTMRPEIKKRFDDYLRRRGLSPSTWLAGALINWADLTKALDAVK